MLTTDQIVRLVDIKQCLISFLRFRSLLVALIALLLSRIYITLQILWITPVNTQSKDECRRTCLEEINNTFNGSCPTPLSCSWQCAAERFKIKHGDCVGDRVYHCARNSTDKNLLDLSLPRGYAYIEACAHAITCRIGIKQHYVFF